MTLWDWFKFGADIGVAIVGCLCVLLATGAALYLGAGFAYILSENYWEKRDKKRRASRKATDVRQS